MCLWFCHLVWWWQTRSLTFLEASVSPRQSTVNNSMERTGLDNVCSSLFAQCLAHIRCSVSIRCAQPLVMTIPTQYSSHSMQRAIPLHQLSAPSQIPRMNQPVRKRVLALAHIFRGYCPFLGDCREVIYHNGVLGLEESVHLLVSGKSERDQCYPIPFKAPQVSPLKGFTTHQ